MAAILYACVCSGTHLNAEAGSVPSKVTLKAFIDGTVSGPFANKDKASFNHDICSYNYIKANSGFTFIAVAPKEVDTRIVYEFLGEMMKEFEMGSDRETYEGRLKSLLARYANPTVGVDKVAVALNTAEETKKVMHDNLVKIADRGVQLEAVEEKAVDMEYKATELKEKSIKVRKCAKWKQLRTRIIICVILLVIIFIVVVAVCGGFSFPKCGGDSSSSHHKVTVNIPQAPPPPPAAAPPPATAGPV